MSDRDKEPIKENVRSTALLHAALDKIVDAILIVDGNRNVLHYNSGFVDLWGISDEVMEQSKREGNAVLLEHAKSQIEDPSHFMSEVELLYDSEDESRDMVVFKDGRTIERRTHHIEDHEGQEARVWVFHDLSESLRAEEEKSSLGRQLRQSQKMEAIGRLAGGVAHDINNVLSAIMGTASILRMDLGEDNAYAEEIETLLIACVRGRDLTKNLLGFARKGKYLKEKVSLNDIVEETSSLLIRTTLKAVDVNLRLDPGLSFVIGDAGQLQHAIMNICINAADAMPKGGVLRISTSNEIIDDSSILTQEGLEVGAYVRLRVEDTGVGMDPDTLEHVFEPFFTTKPEGEGTGLGLSMVYGVAENHNGTVRISSKLGRGTSVDVFLPSRGHRRSSTPKNIADMMKVRPERSVVLLVDDEPMIRRSSRRMLERLGLEVIEAENGLVALKQFEEHPDQISFVLLDMVMPEMDGERTFEEIRLIDGEAKVILCSGYAKDARVERLLDAGAMGFIHKPFDIQALARELGEKETVNLLGKSN